MTQTLDVTMTEMQEAVSKILETDQLHQIDMFIAELRSHGIDEVEQLEEAYSGCFPSVEAFSENLVEDCYHDVINELRGYGLDDAEDLENAYSGCFPSVEAFSENLVEECYSNLIDELPIFLQSAIDYEMVWHQSLQYDYFEIYFNYEYYFFNRNV